MGEYNFSPEVYNEVARMMQGDFNGYATFYNLTINPIYQKLVQITNSQEQASSMVDGLYQELYGRMSTLSNPNEFDNMLNFCISRYQSVTGNQGDVQQMGQQIGQQVTGNQGDVQQMGQQVMGNQGAYQQYQQQKNFSDNFQDPYQEQASRDAAYANNAISNAVTEPPKGDDKKSQNTKKFIIIGVVAAVLIAAIVITIVLVSKNKKDKEKDTETTTEITTEATTTEATTTEETTTEETTTEVTTEATTEAPAASYSDVVVSDNIYDYQFGINGDLITFPISVSDLKALGWECTDDENAMVPSGRYGLTFFKKGEDKIMFYTMNFDVNETPVKDCYICGAKIENYSFKGVLNVAKGIKLNTSTQTSVREALGEPTQNYESDKYPSDTYREQNYQYIKFSYDHANGDTLMSIEVERFVKPEGFQESEINTSDVPAITQAYQAPTEISGNLLDYTIEYDGAIYKLPAPVSQFIANGWEIDRDNSEATIDGQSSGKVTLKKNGQEFWTYVRNYDKNATIIENCFVTELEVSIYKADVSMKLSNGIEKGADEGILESALNGYTVEKKEESSYTEYVVKDDRSLTYHVNIVVRDGKISSISAQYDPRRDEYLSEMGISD